MGDAIASGFETLRQWLYIGICCAIVFLLAKIIYVIVTRLYFHPLRHFPGSSWAKVTDLWSVYHNVKGQSHLIAWQQHKNHGSVVCFGPGKVSISSIAAVQKLYHSKNVIKSQVYETFCPAPGLYSMFTSIDPTMHRQKRKVFSSAFSEKSLRAFEPVICAHVGILIHQIEQDINGVQQASPDGVRRWSTPINMTTQSRYYATDLIGEFCFGNSFDTQTSEQNRFIIEALEGAGLAAGMYAQYPSLKESIVGKLLTFAGSSKKARFGRLVKQLVDKRLSQEDNKIPDLFGFMTNARQGFDSEPDSSQFSMDEIWAESRVFLFAGAQTTATAISACLFYLSRTKSAYEHLRIVLRSTFDSAGQIRYGERLNECKYLWACIDEALRLSPPIPTMLWRRQVEGDDEILEIEGKVIPPGTDFGVSVYVIHHDEQVFDRPFEFLPQRWVENDNDDDDPQSKVRIRKQRLAFNPFGFGIRQCVAMKMAYTEIALCVAKLLWMFEMRQPDDDNLSRIGGGRNGSGPPTGRDREDEFQLYEHINSQTVGPFLQWSHHTEESFGTA